LQFCLRKRLNRKEKRIGKINKELKLDVVAGKIVPVSLYDNGLRFDFIEFINWAVSKGHALTPEHEAFLTMSLSEFDEWCLKNNFIPPKRFNEARAKAANRAANNEQQTSQLTGIKGFEGSQDDNKLEAKKRRDNQIIFICATAKQLKYDDLLNIPEGGKAAIKLECLKNTILFTDAAFGHAWKQACRYF